MKLSFDKFERYELPQVTLCNPNSRATEVDGKITITDTVGVLSNPKGMNLKLNFNAPHELSFDYYRHKDTDPARVPIEYIVEVLDKNNKAVKQIDTFSSREEAEKCVDEFDLSTLNNGEYLNIIKQSFYDKIYEAIQTDRYIYLTDIGYFIISSVTDSDEDNIDKKSISLKSCEENEFATAEGLGLKEGTYQLHTQDNTGLLDLFLPKTAGWTIGFIDPALLTKYDSETGEEKAVERYVEKTEVDNGYNFLYTTIQDMFECIVEPDIIRRTVSVYSRVYYAEHHLTDIHIAKYNLLKHKTVEENDEDKYTALNVQGKDENLEIRTVNPTGKNVIYNFEPRYSWMSSALQQAIEKWQEKCESVEDEYLVLQQGYYNDMQNIVFPLEQDIKVLELQLKQQQQTRDLIVIGEQDKAIDIVESLPQTGKSDVLYFVPTTANNYKEYVWENDSWKYIALIQVDDISDTNQQRALDLVNAAINNTNTVLSEKQSMLEDEKNKVQTNYEEPINQINLDCILDTTFDNIAMESGGIVYSDGQLKSNASRIRTKNYIQLNAGTYTISNSQGFLVAVYAYDNNNNYQRALSKTAFSASPVTFTINTQLKIKFSVKKADDSKLSVSDVTGIKIQKNDGSFATDVDGNTIFTIDLLNELMTHIKPTDYVDEYMLVTESMTYPQRFEKAKELMDRAQSQLVKISSGQKTYSIDTRSFLFNKQFRHFSEQLCAGAIIYVETKNDTMEQLHLTGIDINYDEKSTNFTLGNKYDRSDLKALYEDALGQNSKSFSELKYIAGILEEQRKELDYQRNWVADLRTLTLDNVLTSEDQAIEINNRGLIGRKRQVNADGSWKEDKNGNPLFELEQVKLINNTLVFTEDNWNTASTAVGKIAVGYNSDGSVKYSYGINGQVLIGELILGNNLVLTGTSAGIKITDISGNNVFYADENGNLNLTGTVTAEDGKIGGWNIKDGSLYSKSNNGYTMIKSGGNVAFGAGVPSGNSHNDTTGATFQIYHNGKVVASDAEIEGKITAKSGTIGGWTIGSSIIQKYANGYRSGMASTGGMDSVAFFAGTPNESGAVKGVTPFYVTHSGDLFASKSTIQSILAPTSKISVFCSETDAGDTTVGYGRFTTDDRGTIIYGGAEVAVKSKHDFIVDVHNGIRVINATDWNNETGAVQESFYVGRSGALMPGTEKNNNKQYAFKTTMIRGTNVRLYSHNNGGVYVGASGSTAVTSDENLKDLYPIDDRYEKFFMNLEPLLYKYKVGHRIHLGYGARAVERALTDAGLTTEEFAGILIDRDTNIGEDEVISPDGQTHFDELYSLRYEEFGALYAHMLKKSITRINHLENTVTELKTQLQTLTAG